MVSPVDHRNNVPEDEVRDTESFSQISVLPPAVIVGIDGTGWIVTSLTVEGRLTQAVASLTSTVKLPAVFTLMEGVVSPFDQR